ncbi:MAG: DUF1003 domain-containing protein [Solirubrobacteraceae bacterium]
MLANHVIHFLSTAWSGLIDGRGFDPAPFILLNLVFSAVAFYTGALVIIAQKAQTRTDRANEEAAAKHREELAVFQTSLLQQNTDLTGKIHSLAEQLHRLTQDVHAATCGKPAKLEAADGAGAGDGRRREAANCLIQTETWLGCTARLTVSSRSLRIASISTASRSRAVNAATVASAS